MDILQGHSSIHKLPIPSSQLTHHPENFPQLFYLYSTYYTPYATYIHPLRRAILLTQSYFYRYAFPALYPFYALTSRLFGAVLTEQPSLASLALLAVLLLVSLKVMDMLRRTIIAWIAFAVRMIVYAGVMLMGLWVYQRGFEQSLEDVGWIVGLFAGLGEQGEKVGQARAAGRAKDARRVPRGNARGRTKGSRW
ncbi:MAG: hypothetical protein L6R40_001216 [Gallowayella cf. fulva]|nr:MAG: hypothetical protein L6R40_001216 [Xanthomendoza cf. fulva]